MALLQTERGLKRQNLMGRAEGRGRWTVVEVVNSTFGRLAV